MGDKPWVPVTFHSLLAPLPQHIPKLNPAAANLLSPL